MLVNKGNKLSQTENHHTWRKVNHIGIKGDLFKY
jgi:hypothetical protein